MLESSLGTDILAKCRTSPDCAVEIVKTNILKQDFSKLISLSLSNQSSTSLVARVAEHTSWRHLWDIALDKGMKSSKCNLCESGITEESCFEHVCIHHSDVVGDLSNQSYTSLVARVAEHTSWRHLWDIALDKGVKGSKCNLCESGITEESCFEHVCIQHSDVVGDLSCDLFISTLIEANSDSIFSKCYVCQIAPLCGVFTFNVSLYHVSFVFNVVVEVCNY